MLRVLCRKCSKPTIGGARWKRDDSLCDWCGLEGFAHAPLDQRKFRGKLADEQCMGEVYAIQSVDGGPVKIGKAKRGSGVESRRADIQIGNPSELVIRDTIPGYGHVETAIHRHLSVERIRGEWFLPTARVAAIFPSILRSDSDSLLEGIEERIRAEVRE